MAITTLDGLIAALISPLQFFKVGTTMKAAGLNYSYWLAAGNPGAGVASAAGLAGEALTSPVAGQLKLPAAVGGKDLYVARMEALHTSSIGALSICDRLWQNSGFGVTTLTAQTINSVALPARDINGSTNGEGVMAGMEVITTLGAGTPTLTVTYTNSAGTSGRTGTIGPITTTSQVGMFYPMALQAGDIGVRSIQSITTSATMTSGSVNFVMYRELVSLPMPSANLGVDRDAVALGLPKVLDGTVLYLLGMATATTATIIDGSVTWAQG